MQGRYLIAVLFGGSGGPLAYFGAEKLGAVSLTSSASLVMLGIGWALITPLLLVIASKLNTAKGTL
jgi:tetrahydromethanopterin S-methyltransferase subunit D